MTEDNQQNTVPTPTQLAPAAPAVDPNANPLAQYFRHPKLQIQLPTKGKFWPAGTLQLNEDGSLDVLPMTARDEIMMKSPEGLLSGSSIAQTITSCIPGIKDAYQMPGHDVDTALIAIRLASYEHELEIKTTCPKCKEVNENSVDLRALLDSIPKGNITNVYTINELVFEFKPYTWKFINDNNKHQFEQDQFTRSLAGQDLTDDQKREYFQNTFLKLAQQSTESLVIAISKISLPGGAVVTSKEQITEFINKAPRELIKKIRGDITKMNEAVAYPDIKLTCSECEHEYTTSVEFNQANFFE